MTSVLVKVIDPAELRCQFEISPETIEQELRPVVCEQRQTDLRRIIVSLDVFSSFENGNTRPVQYLNVLLVGAKWCSCSCTSFCSQGVTNLCCTSFHSQGVKICMLCKFPFTGCYELCAVQVRPPCPEGVADYVRPGQDVPSLSEPLEARDARHSEATLGRRDHLQGQLHKVSFMGSYAWRTLADFCCKSGDLPTYAQKLSMYAGLKTC